MSLLQAKVDYAIRGAYDELYTPEIAIDIVIPYIPDCINTVWECTAINKSNISKVLINNDYKVINSHIDDGQDFFTYEPDEEYDMIITNPPYSEKDKFLKRAFELDKPFMMLLPLTTLEGIKRNKMFNDNDIQLLIPNRRFNFIPEKSGAWFQTSWFCYKINLDKTLNFIEV